MVPIELANGAVVLVQPHEAWMLAAYPLQPWPGRGGCIQN
jgi:hypothetical protein